MSVFLFAKISPTPEKRETYSLQRNSIRIVSEILLFGRWKFCNFSHRLADMLLFFIKCFLVLYFSTSPPFHLFVLRYHFALFRTQTFFHLWSHLNISISQNSFSIVFPISHVFSRPNSQDQIQIRCDYLIITMADEPYYRQLARKCKCKKRTIISFARESAPPSVSFSPFYFLVMGGDGRGFFLLFVIFF